MQPMRLSDLDQTHNPIIYQTIRYASEDTAKVWKKLLRTKLPKTVKEAVLAGIEDFKPQTFKNQFIDAEY